MSAPTFPTTIPQVLLQTVRTYPDTVAQLSKNDQGRFMPVSYTELFQEAGDFSAGLQVLGVTKGDPVGLISDNRKEWLVADLAILGLRAADVPRGRDTLAPELVHILGKPGCRVVISENLEQSEKILSILDSLPAFLILIQLDSTDPLPALPAREGFRILGHGEVLGLGRSVRQADSSWWERHLAAVETTDTATIIFTSGTTGEPKGVMLSHGNFCHQLSVVDQVISIKPADVWLSVLPVWHSFERIMQYISILSASTLAYSKPIGKIMLQDFAAVRPMWMASVPRIWEALRAGVYKNATEHGGLKAGIFYFFVALGRVYAKLDGMFRGLAPAFRPRNRLLDAILAFVPLVLLWPLNALGGLLVFSKVKAKLGGRFRAGISGGGSLPEQVDLFFAGAGITLLNGYGLTETAPVIALRSLFKPMQLTMAPLPNTEIRIVDDNGKDCPPGVRGLIMVRGGQVMQGYYHNPEATARILSPDGWLNTGDLGIWTHDGHFAIRGRAKDTIVLMGGENIEPVPIEARLRESEYIEQAVVVGQDEKFLGVLVQVDLKAVELYLKSNGIPYIARTSLKNMPEVKELINEEITLRINAKTGFRPFERIGRFAILEKPFETGVELSAKQEVKRHTINELYKAEIESLFR